MSGAIIRSEIAAALREVGTATGEGPLTAIITRQGATTGPEWNPTPGTPAAFEVVVLDGNIALRDAAGTLTGETMRQLTIEAGVVVPVPGDVITIRGVEHTIETVKTVAPGGVDLMYKVTLER